MTIPPVNCVDELPKESHRVRFVILHHQPDPREHSDSTSGDPPEQFVEHWDLMIEMENTLATWQLEENPLASRSTPIPAIRIADHRKEYLDYEGPVSQGRGEVRRIEQGWCELIEAKPARWLIDLDGTKLSGQYEINCSPNRNWAWQRYRSNGTDAEFKQLDC